MWHHTLLVCPVSQWYFQQCIASSSLKHNGFMQALIGLADGPTVSYLRLHYFSSEGTRAFIDAINMAEYWGVEGYVIDLRNNPGTHNSETVVVCTWCAHHCVVR